MPVLLHPGGRRELGAYHPIHRAGHLGRLVDVVELQLDHVDHVLEAEQTLRGGERCERPGGIDFVEARFEQPGHAEALRVGTLAVWSQFASRGHHRDGSAHLRVHHPRQTGPENDPGQRAGIRPETG